MKLRQGARRRGTKIHTDLNAASSDATKSSYDACIFGTGPAGITVALELAKTGNRIALIEAGSFEYTEESQVFYEGTETGLQGWNAPFLCRLRYFGGTSGHWGGRCGVLDEINFSPDTYFGLPGWPISRAAVLENLAQAADIVDLGKQSLAARPIKDGVASDFVRSGYAFSPPTHFGDKYRRKIIESPNIRLFTRANLVELRLGSPSGKNASVSRALLKNYKGQTFQLTADRYVLALGAIENARILLNSDKEVPGGIGNHSDYVGRCYMEHLNVDIGRFVVRDKSYFSEKKQLELSPSRDLLQSQRIGSAVLALDPTFIPIDYGRLRYFRHLLREGVCKFATLREYARKFEDFNCPGDGVITSLIEQSPNLDSRVTLTSDIDALGLRKINLNWVITDVDRRTIRTLAFELAKEMARLDAARVKLSDFIINRSQPIPINAHCHHMGTTRMSHDPRDGVVDENCKVHGVTNLYIGGASVFPTGGGTNPTFTIVLLALRLAKHLRQLT